jgi:hypothetical protein
VRRVSPRSSFVTKSQTRRLCYGKLANKAACGEAEHRAHGDRFAGINPPCRHNDQRQDRDLSSLMHSLYLPTHGATHRGAAIVSSY